MILIKKLTFFIDDIFRLYNIVQNYCMEDEMQNNFHALTQLKIMERKIVPKQIKVDATKTEYPLLRTIINEIGWKHWRREESREEASLFWNDTYITEQYARRLRSYQRINHFPNSQELGKKNKLAENLNSLRKILPQSYNFFPATWQLPIDNKALKKYIQNNPEDIFIIKPVGGSQGKGIFLKRGKQIQNQINQQQKIVQKYISAPFLLQGSKFDLRLYVLLKSVNPLKIFVYREGLVRFATDLYDRPATRNMKQTRMHLTNYSLNKTNPVFIFNKDDRQDNVGHKRSFSAVLKQLQNANCDTKKLIIQIDMIIVKTILAAQNKLLQSYKQLRDIDKQPFSVCFQIFGFDIIIGEDHTPSLLQVNHTPSFSTDTPMDYTIKKNLLLDSLLLLNICSQNKQLKKKQQNRKSSFQIKSQKINKLEIEQIYQNQHLGGYRRIYPLKNIPQNLNQIKQYEIIVKKIQEPQRQKNFNLTRNNFIFSQKQSLNETLQKKFSPYIKNRFSVYDPETIGNAEELKRKIQQQRQQKNIKLNNIDITFTSELYHLKRIKQQTARYSTNNNETVLHTFSTRKKKLKPMRIDQLNHLRMYEKELRIRMSQMHINKIKLQTLVQTETGFSNFKILKINRQT